MVVFRHQPGNPDNETEDTRIHLEVLLTLKKSLQTIKCGQSHCELVENIDECTAVIAEFPSLPDEDTAMELAQPLYDALIEEDIECSVFVARARRGLTGISAVVGLGLGKILHTFVINLIRVDMIYFEPRLIWPSYVYSVALTFLFAVIVMFVMYFKLQRISMTESLKSIE